MKLDTESKRTVAQFLNALAVALVATMVLAPLSAGTFRIASAAIAACCAASFMLRLLRSDAGHKLEPGLWWGIVVRIGGQSLGNNAER